MQLAKVNQDNLPQTVKTLTHLALWYRDALDDELIAAWKKDTRGNLPPLIQEMPDARVAAGIVEFSWRQARPATFIPAYVPMLEMLMTRYGDSTKPFFEDLLASIAPGGTPLDLSPDEALVVCRILLDLPDLRTWRQDTLRILPHYREVADKLLDGDVQSPTVSVRQRALMWRADLETSALPPKGKTQPPPGSQQNSQLIRRAPTQTTPTQAAPAPTSAAPSLTSPVLLHRVEPAYSSRAKKAKVTGTVVLEVEIDTLGRVNNPHVLQGLGYGLDENAIAAVQKWKFEPAKQDGTPIRFTMRIELSFQLL